MGIAYNTSIVRDGLVLHLDAANPKSYPGSGTVWSDLSGGNHGTMVNGPGYDFAKKGSVVFDGSNDYITGLINQISTAAISVSFWYKTDRTESQLINYLFSLGTGTTQNLSFWVGGTYSSGNIAARSLGLFKDGSLGSSAVTDSFSSLDYNKWWNITFTFDSGDTKIYKNGSLLNMYSNAAAGAIGSHDTFNVCRRVDGVWYAKGSVSDLKVYNRALSASEIQQNFNALRGRYGL